MRIARTWLSTQSARVSCNVYQQLRFWKSVYGLLLPPSCPAHTVYAADDHDFSTKAATITTHQFATGIQPARPQQGDGMTTTLTLGSDRPSSFQQC